MNIFVGVRVLPNWLIDSWISREMSECVVSISLARANRVGFWRRDTKKFCYNPPPPLNQAGFRRSRKFFATTPPPPLNRDGFWRSRKTFATTPPPLNRDGFWRSRKISATTPPPVSCCAPPRPPAPDPPLLTTSKRVTRGFHAWKYIPIYSHHNIYKFSFLPRTIIDWNSLSPHSVDSPSIDTFRARITRN